MHFKILTHVSRVCKKALPSDHLWYRQPPLVFASTRGGWRWRAPVHQRWLVVGGEHHRNRVPAASLPPKVDRWLVVATTVGGEVVFENEKQTQIIL